MSSPAEMLRAIERELKMRKKLYPRWTAERRMSLPQADYEIRIFEEIAEHFRTLVEKEPELFGEQNT